MIYIENLSCNLSVVIFHALINYLEHYNSSRVVAFVLQIRSALRYSLRSLSLLSIARLDSQVRYQVRCRLLDL
jgi:hypothetical protein